MPQSRMQKMAAGAQTEMAPIKDRFEHYELQFENVGGHYEHLRTLFAHRN